MWDQAQDAWTQQFFPPNFGCDPSVPYWNFNSFETCFSKSEVEIIKKKTIKVIVEISMNQSVSKLLP